MTTIRTLTPAWVRPLAKLFSPVLRSSLVLASSPQSVVENTVKAAPDRNYTIFSSSLPGYYGGFVSLRAMRSGDALDVSLFLYQDDGMAVRDGIFRFSDEQADPIFRIVELYSHHGVAIVLNQVGGISKPFYFQFYRR